MSDPDHTRDKSVPGIELKAAGATLYRCVCGRDVIQTPGGGFVCEASHEPGETLVQRRVEVNVPDGMTAKDFLDAIAKIKPSRTSSGQGLPRLNWIILLVPKRMPSAQIDLLCQASPEVSIWIRHSAMSDPFMLTIGEALRKGLIDDIPELTYISG